MNAMHMCPYRGRLLVAAGAGILLAGSLPGAMYLQVDGIPGECTEAEHIEWIDVTAVSFGITQNPPATFPPAEHVPLHVSKLVDRATPLLMQALAGETHVDGIVLEADRYIPGAPGPTGNVVFLQLSLEDALVVDMETAKRLADERPVEEVVFLYRRAEWYVRQVAGDGSIVDSARAYYDVQTGESGVIGGDPHIGQVADQEVVPGDLLDVDLTIEDFDPPPESLTVTATSADPVRSGEPSVAWTGSHWRLSLEIPPVGSGQVTITVNVTDGVNSRSMSFSLFIDATGTPFEGFMQAYFTPLEREDTVLSSPIGDPDNDHLATFLEFLLGSNPREFTPITEVLILYPEEDPGMGKRLHLEFCRRIDEPGIVLELEVSTNGTTWTTLTPASIDPLYTESAVPNPNPVFEDVTSTVASPEPSSWKYLLRFAGTMP